MTTDHQPLTETERAAAAALAKHYNKHYADRERHTADDWAEEARVAVEAARPLITADVLGDHETAHIVEFEETAYSVQHPLSERLDGSLFDCQVYANLGRLAGPPTRPGRYRVVDEGDCLGFEPIKESTTDAQH